MSTFYISESPPHNILSHWEINQNVERRNKKKNVQETNFFSNIIIIMMMMMSRRCRRRSTAVCYRFQCNQSLLFWVSLVHIIYVFTLLDSVWSTVNCVSFVNAHSESFNRSRMRCAHSNLACLLFCVLLSWFVGRLQNAFTFVSLCCYSKLKIFRIVY